MVKVTDDCPSLCVLYQSSVIMQGDVFPNRYRDSRKYQECLPSMFRKQLKNVFTFIRCYVLYPVFNTSTLQPRGQLRLYLQCVVVIVIDMQCQVDCSFLACHIYPNTYHLLTNRESLTEKSRTKALMY